MELRPNQQRAKTASFMLSLTLIGLILAMVVVGMQWNLFRAAANGENVKLSELLFIQRLNFWVSLTYGLLYLLAAIFFIRWFRRAYYNLNLLTSNLKYSDGMAAGAWFIPIFNFIGPYQILKELVVKSEEIIKNADSSYSSPLKKIHVNLYWSFFILPLILNIWSFRINMRRDIDSLIEATSYNFLAFAITFLSGVLLILIINQYAKVEQQLSNGKSEIDSIGEIQD